MQVHIVLGTAKARSENTYPAHEEHAFIVFALVAVEEQAVETAVDHMEKSKWYDVKCQKVSTVKVEMLAGLIPEAREAYEDAVTGKVNAIVFADPVV